MEEKGSDVNLAVHLINDAWQSKFDVALVISNDTDLCTPIHMVANQLNLPVIVANPHQRAMAHSLRNVAPYTRHIRPQHLAASQLPSVIAGTNATKPATW